MEDGARAVISFCILSAIPGYMVVPPDYSISLENRVVYHDNVAVEIFTDIDVAFHDRVVCCLVDTSSFLSEN
jgi:hypothetical protein